MANPDQQELIGFLTRFAAAFTDGGCPPSVRVIRKERCECDCRRQINAVFSRVVDAPGTDPDYGF